MIAGDVRSLIPSDDVADRSPRHPPAGARRHRRGTVVDPLTSFSLPGDGAAASSGPRGTGCRLGWGCDRARTVVADGGRPGRVLLRVPRHVAALQRTAMSCSSPAWPTSPAIWPASGDELDFMTRPAPPLIAEDGFESVATATLGGAQVVTGTDAPTISGCAQSLHPADDGRGGGGQTQVALRLAVTPGDSVLRFSYRFVNPSGFSNTRYAVASPGGTIEWTAARARQRHHDHAGDVPGQPVPRRSRHDRGAGASRGRHERGRLRPRRGRRRTVVVCFRRRKRACSSTTCASIELVFEGGCSDVQEGGVHDVSGRGPAAGAGVLRRHARAEAGTPLARRRVDRIRSARRRLPGAVWHERHQTQPHRGRQHRAGGRRPGRAVRAAQGTGACSFTQEIIHGPNCRMATILDSGGQRDHPPRAQEAIRRRARSPIYLR